MYGNKLIKLCRPSWFQLIFIGTCWLPQWQHRFQVTNGKVSMIRLFLSTTNITAQHHNDWQVHWHQN